MDCWGLHTSSPEGYKTIKLNNVNRLNLSDNDIEDLEPGELAILIKSLKDTDVKILGLSNTDIGELSDTALKAVGEALKETSIYELDLSSNSIYCLTTEELSKISYLCQPDNIKSVRLGHNELNSFSNMQWSKLIDILNKAKIDVVDLSDNYSTNKLSAVEPLIEALKDAEFETLNFSGNKIPLLALNKALTCDSCKITELNLSGINLGRNTSKTALLRSVGEAIFNSSVTKLKLERNSLNLYDKDEWSMIELLIDARLLTDLSVAENSLGLSTNAWQHFCTTIGSDLTKSLHTLDVSRNNLGDLDDSDWQNFLEALESSTITTIYLDGNDLAPERLVNVNNIIEKNKDDATKLEREDNTKKINNEAPEEYETTIKPQ